MASQASSRRPRRIPTSVPVVSRDAENAKPKPKKESKFTLKGDFVGVAIIIFVVLIVLIAIAVPLRTYYEGRSEIARLNESIAAQEQRRDQLQQDINKYSDEEYIKQEARRRLGMIEQGETAWRIVDPRMDKQDGVTTDPQNVPPEQIPWPKVVWNSLSSPEQP
ncbi:FtsB family cell division protein [Corynebacterium sp. S7]